MFSRLGGPRVTDLITSYVTSSKVGVARQISHFWNMARPHYGETTHVISHVPGQLSRAVADLKPPISGSRLINQLYSGY